MNIIVISCPGSRLIARLLGAFLLLAQMTATLEAHDEPDATTPITSGRHTQFQASYAEIVRDTLPAVVNIFSQRHQQQRRVPFQFGNEDLFRFFFPQQQRPRYLLGSGVIVAPHNLLVSNHHVIEGADEIFAVLDDGRHYQVELILSDPKTDLAILRFLDETALNGRNGLDLATDDRLQIGDLVLAIGNPFGVGQTVTSGIVSALDRSAPGISKLASFIQTDASINPGNSGGPLIDMQGQLVAINTAIFSNSGGSVGLGLSVPASMVARVVFDAHHHGELRRPWLGIESHDMSWEQAQALGLDVPIGVAVQKLHMAGSAARSGVQKGDILLELDGKPVRNFANLAFQAATHSPGAVLPLKLLRKGELVKTKLMLTVPDDAGNQPVTLGPATPMAGASAIQITPRAIQRFDLDLELQGVMLADVPLRSAASNNGLKSGDVVLSINGTRITDIAQITEIQPGTIRGWDMVLLRQNRQIRLQFF